MMRTRMIVPAVLAVGLVLVLLGRLRSDGADDKGPMLVHNVFFSLKDGSAEGKKELIASCKKHLKKHPGEAYFAVGPVVDELKREVNDRDFDVALTIVFKNKAAHDQYQDAKRHLQFIEENKEKWKKVRVFDNYAD